MNHEDSFDALARRLSRGTVERRGAIKRLLGAALGLAVGQGWLAESAAKSKRKARKRRRKKRHGSPPPACTPDCGGKTCGGDGCGGSCGACGNGFTCSDNANGGTCRCPNTRACGSVCCSANQTCGSGVCRAGSGGNPDAEERAFLTLINNYRRDHGRASLALQNQLGDAAEMHSQDQAAHNFSSHTGSDGSDPGQRITRAGYDWSAWAENIYWNSGDGSARAAFDWWRNSPGHNEHMLSADYTEIGIGRARSATGTWYWTTDFGRPR
jgi:uncharacterized protein YkwD